MIFRCFQLSHKILFSEYEVVKVCWFTGFKMVVVENFSGSTLILNSVRTSLAQGLSGSRSGYLH
jgi:hypothetical protein